LFSFREREREENFVLVGECIERRVLGQNFFFSCNEFWLLNNNNNKKRKKEKEKTKLSYGSRQDFGYD
jgi:hypothetical protein